MRWPEIVAELWPRSMLAHPDQNDCGCRSSKRCLRHIEEDGLTKSKGESSGESEET